MKKNKLLVIITALLTTSIINSAFALGPIGHRVVAQIAEENLTPSAKKALMQITKGEPLAKLSTWPDEIRSDSKWDNTHAWHYISIDDDESFNGLKRSKKGDILKALSDFEKVLRNKTASEEERWQALAFYIHFTGDIHQPLHVGNRDDLGGNKITVKWFGNQTNLHTVWDSSLINNQQLSFSEYANFLNHQTQDTIELWQNSVYLDWAVESKLLRAAAYKYPEDENLGYSYAYINTPLLNERMSKAGIRLAGMLNDIFNVNTKSYN